MTSAFRHRLGAMVLKELIQMRRDRLTFAMMLGIPVMQLLLFGYAINTNPRELPTAVIAADHGVEARAFLAALTNTGYFRITRWPAGPAEMDRLLASGEVQFGVEIPSGFGRDLLRGERPSLLVIADATDPAATGNALAALEKLSATAFRRDLTGVAAAPAEPAAPFELVIHRRYNPAGDTQFNIVPGLLGVVLTLTMLVFTALSVTREIERGTMESLLAMPLRPLEIMLGKIAPYVAVGFVQAALILIAARFLFGVPILGSLWLLLGLTVLFVTAMLAIGYTFSTVARNQLQAVQMSFFFFLPNLLLSGFMFPFRGMPEWAQWLGEALPLTHYIRIVRGVMLKGSGLDSLVYDTAALALFTLAVMVVALNRFRRTLD